MCVCLCVQVPLSNYGTPLESIFFDRTYLSALALFSDALAALFKFCALI